MKTIQRKDIPDDYNEMMVTESHHDHEIINDLCPLLDSLGYGKNSEIYRKLYRDMGYSLSGYWEIFYWDMNNEEADNYKQPVVEL